jgi:hypothetical protein
MMVKSALMNIMDSNSHKLVDNVLHLVYTNCSPKQEEI